MPAVVGIADILFVKAAIGDVSLDEFADWLTANQHPWQRMVTAFARGDEVFEQQLGTVFPESMTGGQAQTVAFNKVLTQAFVVWNGTNLPEKMGGGPQFVGIGKIRKAENEEGSVDVFQKVTRTDFFNALCTGAVALQPRSLMLRYGPDGRGYLFFIRKEDGKMVPAGKYVMPMPKPPKARKTRMVEPEDAAVVARNEEDRLRTEYRQRIIERMNRTEDVEELAKMAAELDGEISSGHCDHLKTPVNNQESTEEEASIDASSVTEEPPTEGSCQPEPLGAYP